MTLDARTEPLEPSSGNAQWIAQIPSIRKALLHERRHVVVSSGSTVVLEAVGLALVRDLLLVPGVQVMSQQPATTDVILQRFNRMLADLPVDNALERDDGRPETIHVFVVHDGPSMQASDYALMARLVTDLPGAHLRLVVIVDSAVNAQERVQAIGRKAMHWAVGPRQRTGSHWLTQPDPRRSAIEASPAAHTPAPLSSGAAVGAADATLAARTDRRLPTALRKGWGQSPKGLWLGLAAAAFMALAVSGWLWTIDQPAPLTKVTGSIVDAPAPAAASATIPPTEARP